MILATPQAAARPLGAAQSRGRPELRYASVTGQAAELMARGAESADRQLQLVAAVRRQALDDERRRIARELHDSVAQYVLSAGMTIEICRAELETMGGQAGEIAKRLASAKDLTRHAAGQLRAAIYALHTADDLACPLPAKLQRLSSAHHPAGLIVKVLLEGEPVLLPAPAEHSLLRWTGEALFNAAVHGQASRAMVRLRYRADAVTISVSDNGTGDPAQLRRAMRLSCLADLSGWHRGLANMVAVAKELEGSLSVSRSRAGGVSIRLQIPVTGPGSAGPQDDPAGGDDCA